MKNIILLILQIIILLNNIILMLDEKNPNPKLIIKREKGILYSVSSWDGKFYNHTNENAEDFKIDISDSLENQDWKTFIAAKDEVLIGGLTF